MFDGYLSNYLSGTLDDAGQVELFHILAVSDEKRKLFNDHMRLRSMMASDRAMTTVPPDVAGAVLQSAIGASPTVMAPVAAATSMFSKILMPAAATMGMALAGWVGFTIGHSQQNGTTQVAANTAQQAVQQTVPVASTPEVRIQRVYITRTVPATAVAELPLENSNVIAQTQAGNVTAAPVQAAVVPTEEQTISRNFTSYVDPAPVLRYPLVGASDAAFTPMLPTLTPDTTTDEALPRGEMEFGQGAQLIQKSINNSNLPAPQPVSLFRFRFGARISRNVSVGVLVGQNSFGLKYIDQPNNYTQRSISQYSTLVYAGAYGRYSMHSMLGVTPALTLGIAGSSLGPLSEFELSAARPIFGSVSMFAGVHSDLQMFKHGGTWFSSQTISIMAGIGAGL